MLPKNNGGALSYPNYSVSVYLYNSIATQMNMTRFEYRLLRFFNDSCVPLFTFNINSEADKVWRQVVPRHFASLDLLRQSVFAFACLNLWRFNDVTLVLDDDTSHTIGSEHVPNGDFSHIYQSLTVFENTEDNVFSRTAKYFTATIQQSGNYVSEVVTKLSDEVPLDIIFFSSSLIFAYLGLHPHCIMPVVDFVGDPPCDLLSYTGSVCKVFDRPVGQLYASLALVVDEFETVVVGESQHISSIVAELQWQLHDYYYALATFAEINSKTSMENELFENFLRVLGNCISFSIFRGYPVPIFRVLFSISPQFALLVRAQHPFALRLIFIYCCICEFCGFYMLKKSNIWQDYIDYHLKNFGPLTEIESSVYKYVLEKREVDFTRFSASLKEFDMSVVRMAPHITTEEYDFPSEI